MTLGLIVCPVSVTDSGNVQCSLQDAAKKNKFNVKFWQLQVIHVKPLPFPPVVIVVVKIWPPTVNSILEGFPSNGPSIL